MTLEQLFMSALGAACAILGWLARELYSAIQSLRRDLSALELQISRDYVRYDRMKDIMSPIMEALKEIKDTLTTKVDK